MYIEMPKSPISLSKKSFNCQKMCENLDITKPITAQQGVFAAYTDGSEIKKVNLGHGVLCVFQCVDGKAYVLGSPSRLSEDGKSFELQASTGGRVTERVSIKESLQNTLNYKTHQKFPSLDEFSFSSTYFCHRDSKWDMCYLTCIANSKKTYKMEELKNIVKSINDESEKKPEASKERFFYGIYELSEVVSAAQKTKDLPQKPGTPLKNHFT
jgi:hypothetical protein